MGRYITFKRLTPGQLNIFSPDIRNLIIPRYGKAWADVSRQSPSTAEDNESLQMEGLDQRGATTSDSYLHLYLSRANDLKWGVWILREN